MWHALDGDAAAESVPALEGELVDTPGEGEEEEEAAEDAEVEDANWDME